VSTTYYRANGPKKPRVSTHPQGYPANPEKRKHDEASSKCPDLGVRVVECPHFSISPAMSRNDRRHFYPKPDAKGADGLWLYGFHAVRAALANPNRKVKRALLTTRAAEEIGAKLLGRVRHEIADGDTVSKVLPPGAVHQGSALSCEPLPRLDLEDILAAPSDRRRIVLVLDQISDPQNAGAILRAAAAFGVAAVIVQDRHAPPESGTLAKAASGALDIVPYVQVVNISRALEQLGKHEFWRIALAGDGDGPIKDALQAGDVALVLGSEGSGIRRLVREHCDVSAFIPIDGAMESLNVSNAATAALYEMRR
jgi:23S rRNA (guanosine2251-2'-O)-methyltransferase